MDWNQLTALPRYWVPFKSLLFTLLAVPLVPGLLALIIGLAMFKRRVGGVYFAIITQAIAAILSHPDHRPAGLHRRRQRHHRSQDLHGWDIRTDSARLHPLLRQRGAAAGRRSWSAAICSRASSAAC